MTIVTNTQASKNDTIIFEDGTQSIVTRVDRTADVYGDRGVYGSNEDGSEHGPYFPGDYAIQTPAHDLPERTITDYTISHTPRVWVGCLAHYNHGHLVGAWYDAAEAGDITVEEVHRDGGYPRDCEGDELWVFDTNNLGDAGEMSPHEATVWGERFQELTDSRKWPAYLVYNTHFGTNGELPEVRDFEEAYRGRFDEFGDYAHQSAQETGLQEGWSELAQRHFDWDSYTEEVQQDYLVADAHPGFYVFWAHQ